jgi:serine/threonine protein kinase
MSVPMDLSPDQNKQSSSNALPQSTNMNFNVNSDNNNSNNNNINQPIFRSQFIVYDNNNQEENNVMNLTSSNSNTFQSHQQQQHVEQKLKPLELQLEHSSFSLHNNNKNPNPFLTHNKTSQPSPSGIKDKIKVTLQKLLPGQNVLRVQHRLEIIKAFQMLAVEKFISRETFYKFIIFLDSILKVQNNITLPQYRSVAVVCFSLAYKIDNENMFISTKDLIQMLKSFSPDPSALKHSRGRSIFNNTTINALDTSTNNNTNNNNVWFLDAREIEIATVLMKQEHFVLGALDFNLFVRDNPIRLLTAYFSIVFNQHHAILLHMAYFISCCNLLDAFVNDPISMNFSFHTITLALMDLSKDEQVSQHLDLTQTLRLENLIQEKGEWNYNECRQSMQKYVHTVIMTLPLRPIKDECTKRGVLFNDLSTNDSCLDYETIKLKSFILYKVRFVETSSTYLSFLISKQNENDDNKSSFSDSFSPNSSCGFSPKLLSTRSAMCMTSTINDPSPPLAKKSRSLSSNFSMPRLQAVNAELNYTNNNTPPPITRLVNSSERSVSPDSMFGGHFRHLSVAQSPQSRSSSHNSPISLSPSILSNNRSVSDTSIFFPSRRSNSPQSFRTVYKTSDDIFGKDRELPILGDGASGTVEAIPNIDYEKDVLDFKPEFLERETWKAMKRYRKFGREQKQDFQYQIDPDPIREIAGHQFINSSYPNYRGVTSLESIFLDPNNNSRPALVMAKKEGNLNDFIRKCSQQNKAPSFAQIQSILRQVLDAVDKIHALDLIHRDLSCNNILYDSHDMNVAISDIGMACMQPAILCRGMAVRHNFEYQTLPFRAPEICMHDLHYTNAIDIWSVGCIAYALLHHDYPLFTIRSHNGLLTLPQTSQSQLRAIFVRFGTPSELEWPEITQLPDHPFNWETLSIDKPFVFCQENDLLNDLIQQMFVYNPAHRITAANALKHDFFSLSL